MDLQDGRDVLLVVGERPVAEGFGGSGLPGYSIPTMDLTGCINILPILSIHASSWSVMAEVFARN